MAAMLILLGSMAGVRQLRTLERVREEPYMPEVDRIYYRGQGRRRLLASVLFVVIGLMIAVYYVSGMDARMDELGVKKPPDEPPAQEDKDFARLVALYWGIVLVLVGVVLCMAVVDFWATRVYWMARYREIKTDHNTKLQRDLAVYRQQQLNNRMKGLPPPEEPAPEGDPPVV